MYWTNKPKHHRAYFCRVPSTNALPRYQQWTRVQQHSVCKSRLDRHANTQKWQPSTLRFPLRRIISPTVMLHHLSACHFTPGKSPGNSKESMNKNRQCSLGKIKQNKTAQALVFTYTSVSSKKPVLHPACCRQDTHSLTVDSHLSWFLLPPKEIMLLEYTLSLHIPTVCGLRYSKLKAHHYQEMEFILLLPPSLLFLHILPQLCCPLVLSVSQKKWMPTQMHLKSLPQALLLPCKASGQDPA